MKKISILIALIFSMAASAYALTYEEAFETIKNMPQMKGVAGTTIDGNNDFAAIGVTDGQLVVWSGERNAQTEVYGNELYKLMGELPASEIIQCRMTDSTIFAIFARPLSDGSYRVLILSDSSYSGFTGALIGHIGADALNSLRGAILTPRPEGGTALYLNAMNF